MANLGFNTNDHDPAGASFDALPAGTYTAMVVKSEDKQAKSGGNNYYFEFTLEVVDGSHKGRQLWDRINHRNQNEKAQNMGRAKVSQLALACGISSPQDTQQLHNIPIDIEVVCKKRDDKPDEMTNEIKKYHKRGEGPKAAAAASSDGSSSANDPWKK